ncbi:GNAT family N-acetyltransferase [Streptomyces sp. LP05-1]|uniref:GNAT family N-acetyltransferase n=1 Tax=Streptomyces pyxinae TaxID=2970734 RepID=A0ABT2CQ85_9ACTN|nr:GNAT family N-acetyltransferase [Streptomyces sp. LP05-1]MCS0638836.1 GNAT family N-acetyltransferase [Streptomyces sp. LP05-1]
MRYIIRPVRAGEWRKARELRLDALQDPAASIAFLDTYEAAVQRSAAHWKDWVGRVADEHGPDGRQFVAEASDGTWAGSVTVLVEPADGTERFGGVNELDQTHLVGVYARPEARGNGVMDALFRVGVGWSWELAEPKVQRVRLWVHERNDRAVGFYRRAGFEPSGATVAAQGEPDAQELEYELRRPAATG